jgi:uncharacterized membrane protein
MRVILGIPFLLFFPGYTLLASLFVQKKGMEIIEKIALSIVISIAVVGLIGFGLEYTPWGIKLEPILASVTFFIFVTSAIALIRIIRINRANKLAKEVTLNFSVGNSNTLNKVLSIILVVAIFGTVGMFVYREIRPIISERFTEFYILGINSQAQDYPVEFTLANGKVTQVIYGDGTVDSDNESGMITLGIVNHEQQSSVYRVRMTINGEPADINFGGVMYAVLGPVELDQGAQWENLVGIIPQQTGDIQNVELMLFKGTDSTPDYSLNLWITVKNTEFNTNSATNP